MRLFLKKAEKDALHSVSGARLACLVASSPLNLGMEKKPTELAVSDNDKERLQILKRNRVRALRLYFLACSDEGVRHYQSDVTSKLFAYGVEVELK